MPSESEMVTIDPFWLAHFHFYSPIHSVLFVSMGAMVGLALLSETGTVLEELDRGH